ncbi:proteasome subunit alpha type-2-A [Tanacetum coccineum]
MVLVPITDANLQRWIRCDYMVTCWILNSMVTELSEAFLYAQSGCELWKEIVKRSLAFFASTNNNRQNNSARREVRQPKVDTSGETPSDVGCENEIGMGQNGNVDQRLVVATCSKMMKMFKGKGIVDDSGGSRRNYASTSGHACMGDSQYSFSLTTFSPSGKLVQIEHALTAVGSGQTSLGIKASNGVVIATEKKLPSILVDETSVQKIQILTPNIGVVYSGMGPDSRVLVRKSRKQAEQYHRLYKEPIPVTQLVRETAAVMQEFTQSGGVRPFGVSLLVAGYDDKGPQLYQVDPSGSYFSWKASAMGKNVSNAKTFLEKRYTDDMELEDAIHTAILTLKEGVLTAAQIEDYLQEVE